MTDGENVDAREMFRSNKAAIEAWLEGKPIQYCSGDEWIDRNYTDQPPDWYRCFYRPAPSKPIERWEIIRRTYGNSYGFDSKEKAQAALAQNFDGDVYCVAHVCEVIE